MTEPRPASIFYDGEIWEPEFLVENPKTGAKVDPTSPVVVVTKPDGTVEEVAATRLELGVFQPKIPVSVVNGKASRWRAVLKGSGTYTCVGPESITVEPV